MDDLSEFSFLWDGSEPGWTLIRGSHTEWTITVAFTSPGATVQDVRALRLAVPEFRDQTASSVFSAVRGVASIVVADSVGNTTCRERLQALERNGLKATAEARVIHWGQPMSKDQMVLLIEDEGLARAVAERMEREGLPVHQIEEDREASSRP